MFSWRVENKNDYYDRLVDWWVLQSFTVIDIDNLPNKIFVVSHNKTSEDLYAIPLYETNSNIAWIGFPTSNRNAKKEYKEGAFNYLLDKIETCCQLMGFSVLFTTSGTDRVIKYLKLYLVITLNT